MCSWHRLSCFTVLTLPATMQEGICENRAPGSMSRWSQQSFVGSLSVPGLNADELVVPKCLVQSDEAVACSAGWKRARGTVAKHAMFSTFTAEELKPTWKYLFAYET
ncbi:hypothetical protein EV401DRAFT_750605 [Pisolithus croceorrhizus]|nr:hypothetical protein EV401DRAFT_750605 [Pisolithus croceorrhizus]